MSRQLRCEDVGDARAQKEFSIGGAQTLEHLLDQEIHHKRFARLQPFPRPRMRILRQHRRAARHSAAAQPSDHVTSRRVASGGISRPNALHERHRLVDIERQVGTPDLSETALQSQTLHAERRIDRV